MTLTARIVKAYLAGNALTPQALVAVLRAVAEAIGQLHRHENDPSAIRRPTRQQIRDSIGDDFLVSFEDGQRYRMLKRHLTKCGLTPEAYREKWGLPKDYPMVPAFYTRKRAALARRTKLGQYDRSTAKPRSDHALRAAAKAAAQGADPRATEAAYGA
ncbi:MucR family transcriptional regulator [Methylobacterium sp. DB0501]|uniref:MucR family transcriptional regulator n=1 Tax=Methylobacterium sp. DB0501 TaxID=2709665 RepID=UPI0013ED00F7|nr:MucR family transcriptional regulator [Methylobacterium sp. DB0501]NGM37978.1 MucR family transcriptional regulator [Methylobacterium sp. DB0501]